MIFFKKNLIFSIFIFFYFLFLSFLFSLSFDMVGLSFIFNLIFGCFFIGLSLQKNINTLLFFYIFNLLFFVFIPWIHYSLNVTIWANIPFSSNDYILLNILLFFINIWVFIFYYISPIFFKIKEKHTNEPNFFKSLFICFICFIIVFYSVDFNYIKLFLRGLENDDAEYIKVSPVLLILSALARILPAFIFLRFSESKNFYKRITIFLFVLLCAFPLSIPRFYVAYIYLPILLSFFSSFRKSIQITFIMLLSIFIVFPFLNQFRYFSSIENLTIFPEKDFFIQAHFDAYQNFLEVIRVDFITYGYQLLGVILFFIPRSIWPNKPVGSGYQMAENYNYNFNNISMPFLAEGYVNFGYAGLLLFSAALAVIMKQLDFKYLLNPGDKIVMSFGVFVCAGLFFMFRGDLMSSFSYMLSGIFAYKIANRI